MAMHSALKWRKRMRVKHVNRVNWHMQMHTIILICTNVPVAAANSKISVESIINQLRRHTGSFSDI